MNLIEKISRLKTIEKKVKYEAFYEQPQVTWLLLHTTVHGCVNKWKKGQHFKIWNKCRNWKEKIEFINVQINFLSSLLFSSLSFQQNK